MGRAVERTVHTLMARRKNRSRWTGIFLRVLAILLLAPALLVLSMRWIDPPSSAFILKRQYDLWVSGSSERVRQQWVDSAHIAPSLKLAAIAAEDQRFPEHWGFDLHAIASAVQERANNGRVRGASTISQQVAKNLFLWSGRSWLRKGLETYFALLIELCWSKQRILEVYLNIAQFGPSVFGAEAASWMYFNQSADRLSAHQAARLAAVLPNPNLWKVHAPSAYIHGRVFWIEGQMAQLGWDTVRDF